MLILLIGLIFSLGNAEIVHVDGEYCSDLETGQSLLVHENSTKSPTGIARLYEITRDHENSNIYHINVPLSLIVSEYEVAENRMGYSATHTLSPNDVLEHIAGSENLDLTQVKAYSSAENMAQFMAAQETEAAMFVRAQECLFDSHGKVVSDEGEDLRFYARTLNYMGIGYSRENVVAIAPSPHRSSSTRWAEDIDCNVILHEVLHLVGLVDGYEETIRDEFHCRHLEPLDSIMNSSHALSPVYDFALCPENKNVSPQLIDLGNDTPLSCPGDTHKVGSGSRQDMRSARDSSGMGVYYSERTVAPILKKAQVRMILKPYCSSENEQYITCSENAYRSTVDGCIQTPDYCQNGEYLNN